MNSVNLSFNTLLLIKHVLCFDGRMEPGEGKKEAPSTRKLTLGDSFKRRVYLEKFDEIQERFTKSTQPLIEKHNNLVSKKKQEKGEDSDESWIMSEPEILESLKKTQEEIESIGKDIEVKFDEPVWKFIFECVEDFGNVRGFTPADDSSLKEIEKIIF